MRDKQIEEMANTLYENRPYKELWLEDAEDIAKVLYNAGYRKASNAAREIFEDVEKQKNAQGAVWLFTSNYAELKKKYLGEDINAPTKESEV